VAGIDETVAMLAAKREIEAVVLPPGLRVGRRDRSDALYELLDELRRS
jgi:hypothetical protein